MVQKTISGRSNLKVDIDTEGVSARSWPYGAINSVFRDDFRIHSAVAGQNEDILHTKGEADISLPQSDATESVAEVDVVQSEK